MEGQGVYERNAYTVILWPFIMGMMVDGILTGIVFCQAIQWFKKSFNKEQLRLRVLVVWVLIGDLAYTCVQASRDVYMLSIHYGEPAALLEAKMARWITLLPMLVHISIQAFFAERAWLLANRNYKILGGISALIFGNIALLLACMVYFPKDMLGWIKREADLLTAMYCTIAATDIAITITIIILLLRRRAEGSSANRLIRRLVILSIESQLPPSIFAILICVFDLAGHLYLGPLMLPLMIKTTSMTFFGVLNARRTIKNDFMPSVDPPSTSEVPDTVSKERDVDPNVERGETSMLAVLHYSLGSTRYDSHSGQTGEDAV